MSRGSCMHLRSLALNHKIVELRGVRRYYRWWFPSVMVVCPGPEPLT